MDAENGRLVRIRERVITEMGRFRDDYPLDTIRAKREWLGRAAQSAWWVAFSHDVRHTAARLDADGRAAELRST